MQWIAKLLPIVSYKIYDLWINHEKAMKLNRAGNNPGRTFPMKNLYFSKIAHTAAGIPGFSDAPLSYHILRKLNTSSSLPRSVDNVAYILKNAAKLW